MIMPNESGAAGNDHPPGGVLTVPESVHAAVAKACAAVGFFLDRPCAESAREAIAALEEWNGPVSTRALGAILAKVHPRRQSAVAIAMLNLYLESDPS